MTASGIPGPRRSICGPGFCATRRLGETCAHPLCRGLGPGALDRWRFGTPWRSRPACICGLLLQRPSSSRRWAEPCSSTFATARRQHAERTVAAQAQFVEHSILREELRPADLAAPVTGARLAQLDRLFRTRVLVDGALRVKLYGAPDGLVTYSNAHSLIGTKADDIDEFRTVLGGRRCATSRCSTTKAASART